MGQDAKFAAIPQLLRPQKQFLVMPECPMRKIISLICLLLPMLANADELQIRADAPSRYTVVKGDTLWDISGKFYEDPWKWPHIWGLNKDTIKDPHWIYPGDVVALDRRTGSLMIDNMYSDDVRESSSDTVRLSPKIHIAASDHDAIPSIPAAAIEPFLSQPLVIEEADLEHGPTLIGAREGRVILSSGDTAFAQGLKSDMGNKLQIYRPGKTFVDPDSDEVLGIEAIYLGNAEVTKLADVSTLLITHTVQETHEGDRLTKHTAKTASNYLPRAPATAINAKVISVYGGVTQAGQNMAVTLNKGTREGLEIGHVLALYHKGEDVKSGGEKYTLPDERYGLAFVFRVFNKVSYALVMEAKMPVQIMDSARTP